MTSYCVPDCSGNKVLALPQYGCGARARAGATSVVKTPPTLLIAWTTALMLPSLPSTGAARMFFVW